MTSVPCTPPPPSHGSSFVRDGTTGRGDGGRPSSTDLGKYPLPRLHKKYIHIYKKKFETRQLLCKGWLEPTAETTVKTLSLPNPHLNLGKFLPELHTPSLIHIHTRTCIVPTSTPTHVFSHSHTHTHISPDRISGVVKQHLDLFPSHSRPSTTGTTLVRLRRGKRCRRQNGSETKVIPLTRLR